MYFDILENIYWRQVLYILQWWMMHMMHVISMDMMFAAGTWDSFSATLLQLLRLQVNGIHVYFFSSK